MDDSNPPVAASIQLFSGSQQPEEETDRMTRRLLQQMRESGVQADLVHRPGVEAGAKGLELLALGEFLLHLVPAAVPNALGILKDWLDRDKGRHIKLKLPNGVDFELTGSMPMEDIERLVQTLSAAASPAASAP
jgi:hypothetical protein